MWLQALPLLLLACAAAQDVDPEFEKSEKDAARPSKPAPSSTEDAAAEGVIEYNSDSFELIRAHAIKPLCILALGPDETEVQQAANREVLAAYAAHAAHAVRTGKVALHTVLWTEKEKALTKRYFEDVTTRPAIYMIDRSNGAYARPYAAFTAEEQADW